MRSQLTTLGLFCIYVLTFEQLANPCHSAHREHGLEFGGDGVVDKGVEGVS